MEQIKTYQAKNEPVLSYMKGSKERSDVEKIYNEQVNYILISKDLDLSSAKVKIKKPGTRYLFSIEKSWNSLKL